MAKKHYITAEMQKTMVQMIDEFMIESKDGTQPTAKSNRIMNVLYSKYIDRIITGIIYAFRYNQYGEIDDLTNYARWKIYDSIIKRQWKAEKGTIFNFFSTVASNNLKSYTKTMSNKKARMITVDIDTIFDNQDLKHYDKQYDDCDETMGYVFDEMEKHFDGKDKLLKLARVFKEYVKINGTKRKFIKKEFSEYAKSYTFSPSFVNSFFSKCKSIRSVAKLLGDIQTESDLDARKNN